MLCALCSPGCGASSQSLVNLLVATLLKKPAVLRNHQLLLGLQLGLGLVKHFPVHAQSGPAWSHAVSFRDPSPGSLQARQSCHVPKTLLHSSSAQPPALIVFLSPTLERVPDRSGGGDGQDVVRGDLEILFLAKQFPQRRFLSPMWDDNLIAGDFLCSFSPPK